MILDFLIVPNYVIGPNVKKDFFAIVILISLIFLAGLMNEMLGQPSSSSSTGPDNPNNNVSLLGIKVPSNKIVEATGAGGTVVKYSASATDTSGIKVLVNCNPASGSIFSIGSNTVTCGVLGSSETKSFLVTVRDTTPPQLSLCQLI